MIGSICGVIAAAAVVLLLVRAENRARIVGTDIAAEDISQFFYTCASSAYPPNYQRYHLLAENGARTFYHEKREGDRWPLTEADITLSGSVELSEQEWAQFLECLKAGIVRKRAAETESGGSGPWLYLYWAGDRAKYQEFAFSSRAAQSEFERLCEELAAGHRG